MKNLAPQLKKTPSRAPHSLWDLLPSALGLASLAAVGVGALGGADYAAAGFPMMTLERVRQALHWLLFFAVTFLVIYTVVKRWFSSRLPANFAVPWAAAAVAAAPWALWGGYEVNRHRGIRPSELLSAYALETNLSLVAMMAVVWVGICLGLKRAERKTEPVRRGWLFLPLVLLILLNSGLAYAFRSPETKARPDVLVLLVDALRADHLGAYGYERETSPAIDSLAQDGVLFSQTIAQSTFTKSSIASLFTGRNVYQHGVYWGSHKENPQHITSDLLSLEEHTLAEHLATAGYLTSAWVQNSHLRGFMGFSQGFVNYQDQQGSIATIHRRFFRFLKTGARRYPFFTYLHYIDLHDPYRPPAPYDTLFGTFEDVYSGVDFSNWGSYLKAVREGRQQLSAQEVEQLRAYYDGLIRLVDDELARLFAELKRSGLYDQTLIILTSDHGDAFLEHGFISHSTTPYEELVRVPLIVKFPKGVHRGQRVEEQVRLVDVMPTVLALAGVEEDLEGVAGCSLLPLLGESLDLRSPDCTHAVSEIAEEGREPTLAVRTSRYKLIRFAGGNEELYDLEKDPGEQNPIVALEDPTVEELRNIAGLVTEARKREETDTIVLDEQQIKELKALGYLDLQ
jgi:arylsulfatase A-like enzyme